MMGILIEVAVEDLNQIVLSLIQIMTKGIGADGLGVGNAIQRLVVGNLGDGVQRSKQTVFLCSVGG